MLLEFSSMTEAEMLRLVQEVYMEANVENARWRNPGLMDMSEAIKAEELGFVTFLKSFLEKEENRYYVLEVEGQWVSALRLTKLDGFYYLEALETAREQRRKGYAVLLLREVVDHLEKYGTVVIRDNVAKHNYPSLKTHKRLGFVIEEENGIDYLSGERCTRVYGMVFRTKQGGVNYDS